MARLVVKHKNPIVQAQVLRRAWDECEEGRRGTLADAWLKYCMGIQLSQGEADVLGRYVVVNETKRDREG